MNENMSTGNSGSGDSDSDDFFEQLETEVNSMVVEDPQTENPIEQVTQQVADSGSREIDDYEKRYRDSSREAQNLKETLNKYEPFTGVLDAMREDPGMVDAVRGYLQEKQTPPKNVADALNLEEDFIYDTDEAIRNPESESAKVFNHMVDHVVQTRLGEAQQRQKKEVANVQRSQQLSQEKEQFLKSHNMTDADFETFMTEADQRRLTLDDVHYILNRDKTAKKIDNSARQDVMRQMKTAQKIPSSATGASNAGETTTDDKMFDSLLGLEGNMSELFG